MRQDDPKDGAQGVVREIPPRERASNERVSNEGAADGDQDWRMPKLEHLEGAGDPENNQRHKPEGEVGPGEENKQDPERDIEDAACLPVDPELRWARVEFGGHAQRSDDCEKLHERATKHLN